MGHEIGPNVKKTHHNSTRCRLLPNCLWEVSILREVIPSEYELVSLLRPVSNLTSSRVFGSIGQCYVRWAELKGASRIIAIDQVPVSQKIHEMVHGELDVALNCGWCIPRAKNISPQRDEDGCSCLRLMFPRPRTR